MTTTALIASTRFSTDTWNENIEYKDKHEIRGTIYCQRIRIKESVPIGAPMYVVEMNNTTNTIFGVGLIKNLVSDDRYYKVYSSRDFNRHIYRGEYRLDRDEMLEMNSKVVDCFEQICFKGKTHLKRLPGISVISDKLLTSPRCENVNLKKELRAMFLQKYKTNCLEEEAPSASASDP
jgi:hypothetical protein